MAVHVSFISLCLSSIVAVLLAVIRDLLLLIGWQFLRPPHLLVILGVLFSLYDINIAQLTITVCFFWICLNWKDAAIILHFRSTLGNMDYCRLKIYCHFNSFVVHYYVTHIFLVIGCLYSIDELGYLLLRIERVSNLGEL